jgi:beta-N-acetylhexosaminidase
MRAKNYTSKLIFSIVLLLSILVGGGIYIHIFTNEQVQPQPQIIHANTMTSGTTTVKKDEIHSNLNLIDHGPSEKKLLNEWMERSKKVESAVEDKVESSMPQKEMVKNPNVETNINQMVKKMTLKEKIGQLMVVGFQSKVLDTHIKEMIVDYKVGGVIYYDRNMESPDQVGRLTKSLKAISEKNRFQIPMLISVDQEGGKVVRMKQQVSHIPSQQELGKSNRPPEVLNIANRTGKELLKMGINVNYAPVLDLSDTDTRSFGLDAKKTASLGGQVVKGLTNSGVAATLKHFPGNGRSNIDPHEETSSVHAGKADLEGKDIYPFKKIIDEQDNHTFFVMVTHIKYPAYDAVNPASTSPTIINNLLRKQLGFQGVVVTDDLEMGAVSKYTSYRELGVKSIKAGADLLLVCHTIQAQKEVYNGILAAANSKQLSIQQIDEAVKRVLRYKLMN